MPAERTSDARKAARKQSKDEDDIEVKRARGEISCAECRRCVPLSLVLRFRTQHRRLKLKCDKKLPCGSCVRRGCTTICPNGAYRPPGDLVSLLMLFRLLVRRTRNKVSIVGLSACPGRNLRQVHPRRYRATASEDLRNERTDTSIRRHGRYLPSWCLE